MGRTEIDGPVRAGTDFFKKPESSAFPRKDAVSKRTNTSVPAATPTETAAPPNSDWEFYHAGEPKKTEDHLKPVASAPVPARKNVPVLVKSTAPPRNASGSSKTTNAPLISGGVYTLQVAALRKEADALELATRLQKKKFPAFVLSPQAATYYPLHAAPYPDS